MIDWYNLLVNAFWILGSAVVVATLSYASWEASALQVKFRNRIGRPAIRRILNVGGLLFCVGLAGTSEVVWQQAIWLVLAVGFGVQLGVEILHRGSRDTPKDF